MGLASKLARLATAIFADSSNGVAIGTNSLGSFGSKLVVGGDNGIGLVSGTGNINDNKIGRMRPIAAGVNPYAGGLAFDYLNYNGSSYVFMEGARLDGNGNWQYNSGYGAVATAYGCRAWVNFNGLGTVSIRASGNVSSITDLGTGYFQVNFTISMPDSNYSTQICSSAAITNLGGFNRVNSQYGNVVQISHFENGGVVDTDLMSVAIFR